MKSFKDDSLTSEKTIEVSTRDLANAIRFLSMDAVQAANSGHPGMPMGMADIAVVLFRDFLKFDPTWPDWPDRDRFVLSNGHGSMLLYSLLYLSGYPDIDLEQIRRFRQLDSGCAGHPEYGALPGIETTTGPLGQGLANGVGMALAERAMADRFGAGICDHYTYVFAGDGCLMEGISHEAVSLAGHLGLSKLIVVYDDNQISIDGPTGLAMSDDTPRRFEAMGWHTQSIDGHDEKAVANAFREARGSDKPSLIACRTIIGYGAPNKQGSESTHGAALGEDEVAAARENLGWPHPPFEIPDEIMAGWRQIGARGTLTAAEWRGRYDAMEAAERREFDRILNKDLPGDFDDTIAALKRDYAKEPPKVATRKASGMALEAINEAVPETIGGSADLTGSVNTKTSNIAVLTRDDYKGRFIHYGVREHAMAAIMNGMALHGGIIPYSGTFLVFSDYCRPSIRLSALMKQRVIFVMTHDSIGLGEDGPTHQPIEHLAALRAMPGIKVYRPADAVEVAECWQQALRSRDNPSVVVLSRQSVPPVRLEFEADNLCARGAYILRDSSATPQVTLLASGSEVGIAVDVHDSLTNEGVPARVVSVPCMELFDEQDDGYRTSLLAADSLKVGIEAAVSQGWERYIGNDGLFFGMSTFGESAPASDLFEHFGLTADQILEKIRARL